MLRWAGVIGRFFDLPTLAVGVADVSEDDVLDRLDPALEAGLVREEGIGSYLFGHALVRDAIYGSFSATRRARAHARVAEVLEGQPRPRERDRPALAGGRPGARRARLARGPERRRGRPAGARPRHRRRAARRRPRVDRARPRRHAAGPLRPADGPGRRPPLARRVVRPPGDGGAGDRDRRRDGRRTPAGPCLLGDDDRRAVAVGRPRRDPRHGRGGAAPGARRAPRRGRPAALPGDARAGQRALLQRQLRGAPRPDRAGPGHGPAARRRRSWCSTRARSGSCRCGGPTPPSCGWSWRARRWRSPPGSGTSGRSSWPRR